ncbi:plasmid mobilization protein [Novilysobacter antarcticus]|uniref:plasmid mobilization protein n=1 Tax=Novilysobacter antarcticus TaxID=2862543 RepID=UPI001C995F9D|nr:hypothetical protein [Lysobacter antarcticus]
MSNTDPEKATKRVVVLMTPKQKVEVSRRAKSARLSLSAFMCRQALGDEEVLSIVVSEIRANPRAPWRHSITH